MSVMDPAIPPAVVFPTCDDEETWTWIDDRGRETDLPVLRGSEGRFMPPSLLDTTRVFGEAGERRRRQEYDAREIVLPLGLQVPDCPPREALRIALRRLGCQLDTSREPGTLRCQLGGLEAREIVASYAGGMEVTEESTRVATPVLVLRAHEPFWRASEDNTLVFATGTGLPFFLLDEDDPTFTFGNPMPPFTLSVDTIVGSQVVQVPCDVEVWPVWELTGPAENVELQNLTTGLSLSLPGIVLAQGETLTIDTNPGVKTVTDGGGVNRFASLDPASTLFPLAPGSNDLLLVVDGFAQGETALTLRYRRRFLTV